MTDEPADDDSTMDVSNADPSEVNAPQVTSDVKVLGQFTAATGSGILGQNDAGSGTPVGLEGAVPNAPNSGYGISTPHDAKVDGVAELTTLAGSLTGGTQLSSLTGNKLGIDGSGALNWTGTYRTNTFSSSGSSWTPVSGLSAETPVEVTVDTTNQQSGRLRLDVDGSFESYAGGGDRITRVVGPTSSVTLASKDYYSHEKTGDLSATVTDGRGIAFKSDGTKLYVLDFDGNAIFSFALSTAWEVDTASSQTNNLGISSDDTSARALAFKDDGSKVYFAGAENSNVYSYILSTDWDLNTAGSSPASSLDISGTESFPRGLAFNGDGTSMFLVGLSNREVTEWSLSTGWDLDSATATGDSLFTGFSRPSGVRFTDSGSTMFLSDSADRLIKEYRLGTAYDITTATSVDVIDTSDVASPADLAFKGDATKLFYPSGSAVQQYQSTYSGSAYATVQVE